MTIKPEIEREIARLDGFVGGIASCTGEIRSYSAFCYVIERKPEASSFEVALKDFFAPQASLELYDLQNLDGMRELEAAMGPYLMVESPSISDVNALRRFLSFRVMDLLATIISDSMVIKVDKVSGKSDNSESTATFFIVTIKDFFLILQFNFDKS